MGISRWAKVACALSTSFFYAKTGHVAIVPLEQRRTVNCEWYATICLPVVFQELRKTNRQRRITLHRDNASSHTQTTVFLSTQNIDLNAKNFGKTNHGFCTVTTHQLAHRCLCVSFRPKNKTVIMSPPTYSPNLATADFFLLQKPKTPLKKTRFATI